LFDRFFDTFVAISCYAVAFSFLESVFSLHSHQRHFRKDLIVDLSFFLLNACIGHLLLFAILSPFIGLFGPLTSLIKPAITSQPFWLQFIEVMILADFGIYFGHRLLHTVPFLWKFHAVHHSATELDWASSYRNHPVDHAIMRGSMLLPILVIPFSLEVISAHGIFFGAFSAFLHTNTPIQWGRLGILFGSPAFHRWHHSDLTEARDKNFVVHFPWVDALFGTLYLPAEPSKTTGTDEPIPTSFVQQLLYPFRRS
jgi:sterol desaturase/sphingolipid hydroxylase (fatty acid hydroxylase superfamily)